MFAGKQVNEIISWALEWSAPTDGGRVVVMVMLCYG